MDLGRIKLARAEDKQSEDDKATALAAEQKKIAEVRYAVLQCLVLGSHHPLRLTLGLLIV